MSIFKSTQAYVGKSAVHQNAFDDKYTARDFGGASTEVALIARNAVAARAALAKLTAVGRARGEGQADAAPVLEAQAGGDGRARARRRGLRVGTPATAKRHLTRFDALADKAVGLLVVGIPYLT